MKLLHVIFLFICLGLTACYQDIESCLDPLAKNYDLSADVGCKACCLYPDLSIGITHLYGSENYSLNKVYFDAVGDTFMITDQAYYFSNIKFTDDADKEISNLTSKQFTVNGAAKTFNTDYCLLRSTPIACITGSGKFAGATKSLQFLVGLSEELSVIDSAAVVSDKNLTRKEILFVNEEYKSAFFKVKTKTGSIKSIYLSTDIPITLTNGNPLINVAGETIQYKIKIDYATLFSGIAFENDSEEIIQTKLTNNFKNAISNN